MKKNTIIMAVALTLLLTNCTEANSTGAQITTPATVTKADADVYARFEERLETLRQRLKIPGFSAAIVKQQELVWAKGFGYADLENKIEATPETPYHLASLTKPFAAAVIMQLVEEGVLDLNDPISKYGVILGDPGTIKVWHLLSMTSDGVPGASYRYDGSRFDNLSDVIKSASGESFQELLFERIVEPLSLTHTAPSPGGWVGLVKYSAMCEQVFEQLAAPYALGLDLEIEKGHYHASFGTAAGLISTVVDLAKFDAAMDENLLVSQATKEQMFAPTISTHGAELPYGLGWFSQEYRGTRLIWHYGHWRPSVSSLIVKAPDENLTFIVLANTDNLSRPYPLADGDAMQSSAALAFYRTFILEPRYDQPAPEIDWEAQQGDAVTLLSRYDDDDLRDLLTKERAAHMALLASYGRLAESAERIASMTATDVDPEVFWKYVGQYEVPAELGAPFDTVAVTIYGQKLFLEIPDGPAMELYPQSESSFFFLSDASEILELAFIIDDAGHVTEFTAGHVTEFTSEIGGQGMVFKRRDG